jgi:predicted thioesterase
MDTLKVGMRDEMTWEVTEDLATSRGDYKVFLTPGMTRFVEMTAHKLVGPHLRVPNIMKRVMRCHDFGSEREA